MQHFQFKRPHLLCLQILMFLCVEASWAVSTEIRMVAIGDSITAGLMRDGDDNVTCPHNHMDCFGDGALNSGGFVPSLTTELSNVGFQASVFNWGYSGLTSSEVLNNISAVITVSQPNYITIMAGANDAVFNVSRATLKFNYQRMAEHAISKNVTPILGTVTPDQRNLLFEANINKYNTAINEVAAALNVPVADQFSKMNENFAAYHSGDLKHFNNLGNQKMAEEWMRALSTVLMVVPVPSISLAPIYELLLD